MIFGLRQSRCDHMANLGMFLRLVKRWIHKTFRLLPSIVPHFPELIPGPGDEETELERIPLKSTVNFHVDQFQ